MAAEVNKPDFSYQWSSGGSLVAPSNVKIQTGWIAEVPPFQWENWSQNRQDNAILHLFQKGISEWDTTSNYYFTASGTRSYVQGSDGNIYVALQDSVGQNPTTDTSEVYWANIFKKGFVVISTTGVTSWTVPPILKLGLKTAKVTVISAGGGGGENNQSSGRGGGGGAGAAAIKLISLLGVSSVSVTVGAGTTTNGGSTSFGEFCSATGGVGGGAYTGGAVAGGAGGVGSNGDLNLTGADGSDGPMQGGIGDGGSGDGGNGLFGGSGRSAAGNGLNGHAPGAGGGGSKNNFRSTGANGLVIIEW